MNDFQNIIKEICDEEGIKFSILSKDWVIMLEKGDKTRFISGYKFDLNGHGLGNVMDDKYAMYEILCSKGLPSIEYNILFRNDNYEDNYKFVVDYFHNHDNSIVIKPNDGTCGINVIHIVNEEDIDSKLSKLLKKNYSISVCPYYEIENEYRCIMIDDEVQISYKKIKPAVVGDGKKSIKELLIDFNSNYFSNLELDDSYNRVLDNGEKFEYDWRFNLSQGAIAMEIDEYQDEVSSLATKISKSINLGFGSIDIIRTVDNEFYIMELNSGVMTKNFMHIGENGMDRVKNTYKKAILKLFQ